MKFPKLPFAGTLLLSYAVYTCFVQVSIAHSIILLSLAVAYSYDSFLKSIKTPSILKLMTDMQEDFNRKLKEQKESHEAKLQEVKEEQQKHHIAKINSSASSPKKAPIQF